MVYSGGPPLPGRATAVERLTRYRHKDCDDWSNIPFNHHIPRINDEHDEDAAEKESRDYVESVISGSDFSDARRKKKGRPADNTSDEDSLDHQMDVVDDDMVSNVVRDAAKSDGAKRSDGSKAAAVGNPKLASKSKALLDTNVRVTFNPEPNSSKVYEKKREWPSKEQLAEVHDLEVHIRTEVADMARRWGVGVDVIFEQLGLGGVGVKKDETLWNTVLKVCSVTVPSNGNRKFFFLAGPVVANILSLRQRLDPNCVNNLP